MEELFIKKYGNNSIFSKGEFAFPEIFEILRFVDYPNPIIQNQDFVLLGEVKSVKIRFQTEGSTVSK